MNQHSDREHTKHFIVNGFRPSPHPPVPDESRPWASGNVIFGRGTKETREQMAQRYRESGMEVPILGETEFLNIESIGTISVFVFGVYEALFLITATNQQNAYLLANALRSFLVVTAGCPIPDHRSHYYLLELESTPESGMTMTDLIAIVKPIPESQLLNDFYLELELSSGVIISHNQIREVCNMIAVGVEHPKLLAAIRHLEYSYSLCWGYMTQSYYDAHYSRERRKSSEYELEKLYLEHGIQFDLAFLSAFRGIESLLDTPFLRRHEIAEQLAALDREFLTSFQTDTHECFHLIFSGEARRQQYQALIEHFLVLRNSVAAHANTGSPRIIMEHQVNEIQRLVEDMLSLMLVAVSNQSSVRSDRAI